MPPPYHLPQQQHNPNPTHPYLEDIMLNLFKSIIIQHKGKIYTNMCMSKIVGYTLMLIYYILWCYACLRNVLMNIYIYNIWYMILLNPFICVYFILLVKMNVLIILNKSNMTPTAWSQESDMIVSSSIYTIVCIYICCMNIHNDLIYVHLWFMYLSSIELYINIS